MHSIRSLLLGFLVLCLCLNVAVAQRHHIVHRQESQSQATTVPPTSTNTAISSTSTTGNSSGDKSSTRTDSRPSSTTETSTNSGTSSTSRTSSQIPTITGNLNGPAYTGVFYNATLNPDELPLQPEVTPAFAVGGVLLISTGAVYALIGIKNKMLHVALSTAYLTSLSVTVLILYLLSPPVSNAIQGAYLVAIVMTGLILGGGSVVFTEMTEGLGALLGGFCLSMWLLVLVPGGLLKTVSSIAIFISCFTVAAFATTFSHHTRPYGLIGGISFAGATVTVLGIDCFSKAGLKEFWAYIWNLNGNLFPLGANTYPITRGIKVEIAAIIVIFLLGLVSQMKLWTIIKEQRAKREAHRLEDERNLAEEEAGVGKRIEGETARDRGEWEAVYGDKDESRGSESVNGTKKGAGSTTTAVASDGDDIELADMPQTSTMKGAGLVTGNQTSGIVTVRVIQDDIPEASAHRSSEDREAPNAATVPSKESVDEAKNVWVVGADGEARPASVHNAKRDSKRKSGTPSIIPLPFRIPNDDTQSIGNRSSVATFNDDDAKRHSKRLSGAGILRSLSRQSGVSTHRQSKNSTSRENLFASQPIDDDRSSLAATVDDVSDDESRRFGEDLEKCLSQATSGRPETNAPENNAKRLSIMDRPRSQFLEPPPMSPTMDKRKSLEAKSLPEVGQAEPQYLSLTSNSDAQVKTSHQPAEEKSKNVEKKIVPEPELTPLSEASLPPTMSKVVMSYRTNEWAKHLSHADTPELDELSIAQPVEEKSEEAVAPVNVAELQQTPHTAVVPPAPRSIPGGNTAQSQRDSYDPYSTDTRPAATPVQISRSPSTQSLSPSQMHSSRSLTATPLASKPILVETSAEGSTTDLTQSPTTITNSPALSASSPSTYSIPSFAQVKHSTLLGQRDSYLRTKSAMGFAPGIVAIPEASSSQNSSSESTTPAHSLYGGSRDTRLEDDNISLSARRSIMHQNSTNSITMAQAGNSMYGQSMPSRSSASLGRHSANGSSVYLNQNGTTSMNASRSSLMMQQMQQMQGAPANFDSHQPQRSSTVPDLVKRESQLSEWRASVARDIQSGNSTRAEVERSRSLMVQERALSERERRDQERKRAEQEKRRDEQMRKGTAGDMAERHREAMRRMQAKVKTEGET